jgi:hypothetical protein
MIDRPVNRGAKRAGAFELIARYFAPLAKGFPGAYGLRDDVAVITPAPGNELIVKTAAESRSHEAAAAGHSSRSSFGSCLVTLAIAPEPTLSCIT